MSTPLIDPLDRDRSTYVRQVAGLALVGAGTAGLVACAFVVGALLGAAALSVAVVGAGVLLGRD